MQIRKSAEDYLETILILQNRNGAVRSIDIATALGYKKPSISYAMKQFREAGYIQMDEKGYITLLPSGLEIAQRILERHQLLTDCLMAIGVGEETAREDACRIEHDLSPETFIRLREHFQKNSKKQL